MKINFLLFLSFLFVVNCKKSEADNPRKGEMTVVTDESFQNVTEALTERYVAFYPDTKIKVKLENENQGLTDLLNDKVRVVVMSRSLTQKEKDLYQQKIGSPAQLARFAADAVVFITSKNSNRNNISVEDIKKELISDDRTLIFDGVNSSNFNFVAQKFKLNPKDIKCSILKSNKEIIEKIDKYPNSIGVISYNTISSEFSKEAADYRSKIKILPVIDKGISYEVNRESLKKMTYPFTRVLYFLTNEGYFGLGNGLIRFSCTQIGQIVVSKEGLQPFYFYNREVQMK